MVEVEMCEYDIRNILTGNIPPLKFILQIDQVEEVVIAELFQVFVARPLSTSTIFPFPSRTNMLRIAKMHPFCLSLG